MKVYIVMKRDCVISGREFIVKVFNSETDADKYIEANTKSWKDEYYKQIHEVE